MKASSFGYLLREGARNVWVNRMMSAASVGVLTACLLLIGGALLFSVNVNSMVGYVESQNEVKVFLKDEIPDMTRTTLDNEIRKVDNISEIDYMPKEEGIEKFSDTMGDYSDLMAGLHGDENPLPDTYMIKVADLSKLPETVQQLKGLAGVESVSAPMEVASSITGIKNAVTVFGIFIVGILVLVSLIITANTIKIAVYNRRREINIMKFVGATDSFIRLPFIIEGTILGFLSALTAFAIVWGGYDYLLRYLSENATGWLSLAYQSFVPFTLVFYPLLVGFLSAGLISGTFGSMMFVRKHLRV
ncbi:MAG: permease-like cell division protein FtsX [Acetanaerobacterium sp.]